MFTLTLSNKVLMLSLAVCVAGIAQSFGMDDDNKITEEKDSKLSKITHIFKESQETLKDVFIEEITCILNKAKDLDIKHPDEKVGMSELNRNKVWMTLWAIKARLGIGMKSTSERYDAFEEIGKLVSPEILNLLETFGSEEKDFIKKAFQKAFQKANKEIINRFKE